MPTTGLAALEEPFTLIAGDDTVEECLFRACVVEVVVDDVVAECSPCHASGLESRDGLAERAGKPVRVGLVRVSLEGRWRLERLLDPVQARRDQRREGEIRVDVATRNPGLDAKSRPVTHDPETARPVVAAPRQCRRR